MRTVNEHNELNRALEFDCPIVVHAGGRIEPGPANVHAPDVFHDELADMLIDGIPHGDSPTWEALTGYTGQWSYNGPVMHASEYVGGRLADDILNEPGVYVVVVVNVEPDELEPIDPEPAGWAILRLRHVNYPHWPGRLYDCRACESACYCVAGETECVYAGTHNGSAADS